METHRFRSHDVRRESLRCDSGLRWTARAVVMLLAALLALLLISWPDSAGAEIVKCFQAQLLTR